MKKIIYIIIILALVIGFFVGKHLYEKEKNYNNVIAEKTTIEETNKVENNIKNKEIETSAQDEKISVNTKIVEQVYYNKCNHMIETEIKDKNQYVNMTKEVFSKKFPAWAIKKFDADEVILYKEDEDYCNEHFLAKDVDGYITIYTLDSNDEILEILRTTDISTSCLAEADKTNFEKGIIIYTKQNLTKLIEDFE